jgi:signal transduction protein with GAF and PtsI domain
MKKHLVCWFYFLESGIARLWRGIRAMLQQGLVFFKQVRALVARGKSLFH